MHFRLPHCNIQKMGRPLDVPIILNCRLSSARPDKIPITSLTVRLGKASRSLSLLLQLPITISFICRHVCKSCQHFSFCLWAQLLIAILITVCAIGNDGYSQADIRALPKPRIISKLVRERMEKY